MNPVDFHRHDDLGVWGVTAHSEDGSGSVMSGAKGYDLQGMGHSRGVSRSED